MRFNPVGGADGEAREGREQAPMEAPARTTITEAKSWQSRFDSGPLEPLKHARVAHWQERPRLSGGCRFNSAPRAAIENLISRAWAQVSHPAQRPKAGRAGLAGGSRSIGIPIATVPATLGITLGGKNEKRTHLFNRKVSRDTY